MHVRDVNVVACNEFETGFTCRRCRSPRHWSHEHRVVWEKILRINTPEIRASLSSARSDITLREGELSGVGNVRSGGRRDNESSACLGGVTGAVCPLTLSEKHPVVYVKAVVDRRKNKLKHWFDVFKLNLKKSNQYFRQNHMQRVTRQTHSILSLTRSLASVG
jgi:hypothetical protein